MNYQPRYSTIIFKKILKIVALKEAIVKEKQVLLFIPFVFLQFFRHLGVKQFFFSIPTVGLSLSVLLGCQTQNNLLQSPHYGCTLHISAGHKGGYLLMLEANARGGWGEAAQLFFVFSILYLASEVRQRYYRLQCFRKHHKDLRRLPSPSTLKTNSCFSSSPSGNQRLLNSIFNWPSFNQ